MLELVISHGARRIGYITGKRGKNGGSVGVGGAGRGGYLSIWGIYLGKMWPRKNSRAWFGV